MDHILVAIILILSGLPLLFWSSDQFVEGAVDVANCLGMNALLIGIFIVGFGTSVPEMLVSAMAAWHGNPILALGNAYGSNITNIALILGLTAVLKPITVQSQVLRQELPILTVITVIAFIQLFDGHLSRLDSSFLLVIFSLFVGWSIWQGGREPEDNLGLEVAQNLPMDQNRIGRSLVRLVIGLVLLIISSRMLVEGAVDIAQAFGISDLIIGLTIVAVGTSLPELATSIMAIKKGEHDIALGNVIGSNLFNTLVVVGISGMIRPIAVPPEVLFRDFPVMGGLTSLIFVLGFAFRGEGRINRYEGVILLIIYVCYLTWLIV